MSNGFFFSLSFQTLSARTWTESLWASTLIYQLSLWQIEIHAMTDKYLGRVAHLIDWPVERDSRLFPLSSEYQVAGASPAPRPLKRAHLRPSPSGWKPSAVLLKGKKKESSLRLASNKQTSTLGIIYLKVEMGSRLDFPSAPRLYYWSYLGSLITSLEFYNKKAKK